MSKSAKDLDPAFQGAGQKPGIEIWRIENLKPVPVPKSSHGKFYTGDAFIILKTTASKSGALNHDIHYWLGKDTSQDEARAAAIKTVELAAILNLHAVQYREVQGHESEKFLSYFRPCIIPQEGGAASGFNHVEVNEHEHTTRLYTCKGKHVVRAKEVPFARSTLNHDSIFILDTRSKIFQFNGSNSSIQERAKALEVVQYIKDTYHGGKCGVGVVEDGKLMADADAGDFWALFGGFAPLPRKPAPESETNFEASATKLMCIEKGQPEMIEADPLTRELLETNKCYLLDLGAEVFIWSGRSTSLEERKTAITATEELIPGSYRSIAHIICVSEGYEPSNFRSKFNSWPPTANVAAPEEGRGKVAALLKRQGLNVRGLLKADPVKEEPQPYIDCTGNLQLWHVDGQEKNLIPSSVQFKFYSGDCYIFQYAYPGEDREEVLIGTWFGQKSVQEERAAAISITNKMVESTKYQAVQTRLYEGKEPIQFFSILQSFVVYKGGLSSGYKNYITDNNIADGTYSEEGLALFRIQGSGPENMQAIQVEPVASSLNSSYCYILHSGDTAFTWLGNLTSAEDQDLVERQLDLIKPNAPSKPIKEGSESEQFWDLLGGKCEYPSQKITKHAESDAHLFCCNFSDGNLKVQEIFSFCQNDLMTEDIFILDCHSNIFVWVGQQVDSKHKMNALKIGEEFLEKDFLLENLSLETSIFFILEGSEPSFFTCFFTWDSTKSAMHGNSFQRRLAIVKGGVRPTLDKPKRRPPVSYVGRSSVAEKSHRSRSMSFSPDKARLRGRSPAFNALAAAFENPSARNPSTRNLSMPPPVVRKLYPKSASPETSRMAPRSAAIAALSSTFELQRDYSSTRTRRGFKSNEDSGAQENSESIAVKVEPIHEDAKEGEAEEEEGIPIFPYEQLTTDSADPAEGIDVTKRERYLSPDEFTEKFNMPKRKFYKLPKWKQNKLKMPLKLF